MNPVDQIMQMFAGINATGNSSIATDATTEIDGIDGINSAFGAALAGMASTGDMGAFDQSGSNNQNPSITWKLASLGQDSGETTVKFQPFVPTLQNMAPADNQPIKSAKLTFNIPGLEELEAILNQSADGEITLTTNQLLSPQKLNQLTDVSNQLMGQIQSASVNEDGTLNGVMFDGEEAQNLFKGWWESLQTPFRPMEGAPLISETRISIPVDQATAIATENLKPVQLPLEQQTVRPLAASDIKMPQATPLVPASVTIPAAGGEAIAPVTEAVFASEGKASAINPALVSDTASLSDTSTPGKPQENVNLEGHVAATLQKQPKADVQAKATDKTPLFTGLQKQAGTDSGAQTVASASAAATAATAGVQTSQQATGQTTTSAAGDNANTSQSAKAATSADAVANMTKNDGGANTGDNNQKPTDDRLLHQQAAQAQQSQAQTRVPQALTPERLASFNDLLPSESSSALSPGLLKAEGGQFAASTVFGGKPNPAMAKQMAQQVNLNITRAVQNGQQEFTMRLNPAELGRVTVKMKFMHDGMVRAHVLVENPETLEMLQKDARSLERAIEAGGHKTEQGGLSFGLDKDGQESAGKAFAEAVQQEKMREELAANAGGGASSEFDDIEDADIIEEIPLDEILANVTVETGLDVRV